MSVPDREEKQAPWMDKMKEWVEDDTSLYVALVETNTQLRKELVKTGKRFEKQEEVLAALTKRVGHVETMRWSLLISLSLFMVQVVELDGAMIVLFLFLLWGHVNTLF